MFKRRKNLIAYILQAKNDLKLDKTVNSNMSGTLNEADMKRELTNYMVTGNIGDKYERNKSEVCEYCNKEWVS